MKRKKKATAGKYVLEDQIGYVLRLVFQHHTAIFTAKMVDGMTQMQYAALSKIHQSGPCSQSDLCRLIEVDSATINGVVARMRARGFIQITGDPSDKRRQILSLSQAGASAVKNAEKVGKTITDETLAHLSKIERARLLQLLRKITEGRNGARYKHMLSDSEIYSLVRRTASNR